MEYRSEIKLLNVDCLEYMKTVPNNHFDLAIVDPPYGIDAGNMTMGNGKNKKWGKKDWDKKPPSHEYFKELFRVSKNQIICGGNYFNLPIIKSWVFWDKGIYGDCSFADGELIWTSFNRVLRVAKIKYKGFLGADKIKIHPTQKPVALYKWLLQNYAKKGDKIFDSHLGSGSIAIACDDMGFDLVGCEIDLEYYNAAIERLKPYRRQTKLF